MLRALVKPVHLELVKQNMISEVTATEVIMFTQVPHLTQCSPRKNCETFSFAALIMWNKLRQISICCTIRDLGKHTPTRDYDLSSLRASGLKGRSL